MGALSARHGPLLASALIAIDEARRVADVVDGLRHAARDAVGADGITLVRREGDEVRYIAEDAIGPLWLGQSFPLPACISGLAMRDAKTIVIDDIANDPRVPYNAYRATFVKSMIMTPVGDEFPQAAIGAYWARVGAPTRSAVVVMRALARAVNRALVRVETPQENLRTYPVAA